MENMNDNKNGRDYSDISVSAKTLLLLKGLTDIPFAKETAELVMAPEPYVRDFGKKDFTLWVRVMHFEVRYKSINQLLTGLDAPNVLELSSGFSFRGLDMTANKDVHYIDTDLPDLIATKRSMVKALQEHQHALKGKLEILPLNAVDEQAFKEVVSHFGAGELAIVNEGLLMYLNVEEKKKLCSIIRDVLKERGGCWITADIYIKTGANFPAAKADDELERFLETQNIEANKFDSFEAAEAFFAAEGFVVDKEADQDYAAAGALPYLMASINEEQMANLSKTGKMHATWRLKLKA